MIEPGSEAAKALADYASDARQQTANAVMRAINNRAEINRLRADFLEYATHKAGCRGGDGERCACGYLDAYNNLKSE